MQGYSNDTNDIIMAHVCHATSDAYRGPPPDTHIDPKYSGPKKKKGSKDGPKMTRRRFNRKGMMVCPKDTYGMDDLAPHPIYA